MPLQSRAIPVIITRPEPQATRFARELMQKFENRVLPVISPLLDLTFTNAVPPSGQFGALILTSEMGARSARRLLENGARLPKLAYCVGDRTAQVANSFGFEAVSAKGDAQDLISLLAENKSDAPFLHLRGGETRGDIVGLLLNQNVEAADLVTYLQEPVALTAHAKSVLSQEGDVFIPLFSPRTAKIWVQQIERLVVSASLRYFAISPAVAAELERYGAGQVAISESPTQESIRHMMSQALFGA